LYFFFYKTFVSKLIFFSHTNNALLGLRELTYCNLSMNYELISSWGPTHVPTMAIISGIVIFVGTFSAF